jgi:co-chaperonin GroES (HSP10)
MSALIMAHDGDPKQKLLDEIGDLSQVELFNNQILVAVYVRPTKTKSGLYLTDKYADEDKFQGKVGLLVGMGPAAFQDDSGQWFNDASFNLHDWLVYRPSDGWSITINGVLCRMLSDTQVKMRIPTPDTAW